MIVHRSHPESRFTIIPDQTLRDPRLSYLARGVLAEILSRPDDWQTTADAIAAAARRERGSLGEGRRIVRAAFAELATCGYLQRVRCRNKHGHIVTDLHIYDVPAGRTDDHTGGMSGPPGQTDVPAGRTDVPPTGTPVTGTPVTGTPVTGTPVGGTSLRRPDTEIEKKTDHENGSLSSVERAAQRLIECGGTEREIRYLIDKIGNDPKIRHAGPYLSAAIDRGDAPVLLAEARQDLATADAMHRAFGWRDGNGTEARTERSAACRTDDHEFCPFGASCPCDCHRAAS